MMALVAEVRISDNVVRHDEVSSAVTVEKSSSLYWHPRHDISRLHALHSTMATLGKVHWRR